jgi:hypothetical protein
MAVSQVMTRSRFFRACAEVKVKATDYFRDGYFLPGSMRWMVAALVA